MAKAAMETWKRGIVSKCPCPKSLQAETS